MGETISQRKNVMFEQGSKGEYQPLGARISSTIDILFASRGSPNYRTLLYERIWLRDSPLAQPGVYLRAGDERYARLFVWFTLDQVRVRPSPPTRLRRVLD